jgi:hypothetical protein
LTRGFLSPFAQDNNCELGRAVSQALGLLLKVDLAELIAKLMSQRDNVITPTSGAAATTVQQGNTPRHGSWLDLRSPPHPPTNKPSSTNRRLAARPQFPTHQSQLAFTTANARIKLNPTESGD